MSKLLNELNDKQRLAAENFEGPLLILAGAGSGKTRTITYRIANMISEGIKPYHILAVTFTNKAAKEMKERVEKLVGSEASMITISTFHSFGVKLLRQYGEILGYTNNFTIYDQDDQKKLIKEICKNDSINISAAEIRDVLAKISKLKETAEQDASSFDYNYNKISKIYEKYNRYLKENNAMDFSDILQNTYLLLKREDILEKIRNKFRYVMIDEYQDTNDIQYNIVKKIVSKHKNICVVGDENQSIYAFRGANIQNILNFEKDYPDAMIVKLEENYRSTPIILEAANEVIKNNISSKDKNLWTKRKSGEKIKVLENRSGRDEAWEVVRKIENYISQGKKYKDITILYRINAQSRLFEEAFLRSSIPYKVFGGVSFYGRAEIKDIIAYLSIIVNNRDELNLKRIINIPKRNIGDKGLEKLQAYANDNALTLFETLNQVDNISGISSAAKEKLKDLYNLINNFSESMSISTASEIVEDLLDEIDYNGYIENTYENPEERKQNVKELLNSIYEIENIMDYVSLDNYLENISLVSATDNLTEDENYVKLMTVHNAKGLEFPIVFIVGFESEYFPGNFVEMEELEEERRLCYVALTRAEDVIYLSYARERNTYGKDELRAPSMFFKEIPESLLEYANKKTVLMNKIHSLSTEKAKTVLATKNTINASDILNGVENLNFKNGDRVKHKKFGLGMVVAADKKKITVSFVDGRKDIATALADKFLEKIN